MTSVSGGGLNEESQLRNMILQRIRMHESFSSDAVIDDLIETYGENAVVANYHINHNESLKCLIYEVKNTHYEFLTSEPEDSSDNEDKDEDFRKTNKKEEGNNNPDEESDDNGSVSLLINSDDESKREDRDDEADKDENNTESSLFNLQLIAISVISC